MKRFIILKTLRILMLVALAVTLLGAMVMSLWNWLLPPLAGWHPISFLQAMALLVLCRILFGSHRGAGGQWRQHWKQRFERMTPEERQRFRDGLSRRWNCSRETPHAEG